MKWRHNKVEAAALDVERTDEGKGGRGACLQVVKREGELGFGFPPSDTLKRHRSRCKRWKTFCWKSGFLALSEEEDYGSWFADRGNK